MQMLFWCWLETEIAYRMPSWILVVCRMHINSLSGLVKLIERLNQTNIWRGKKKNPFLWQEVYIWRQFSLNIFLRLDCWLVTD